MQPYFTCQGNKKCYETAILPPLFPLHVFDSWIERLFLFSYCCANDFNKSIVQEVIWWVVLEVEENENFSNRQVFFSELSRCIFSAIYCSIIVVLKTRKTLAILTLSCSLQKGTMLSTMRGILVKTQLFLFGRSRVKPPACCCENENVVCLHLDISYDVLETTVRHLKQFCSPWPFCITTFSHRGHNALASLFAQTYARTHFICTNPLQHPVVSCLGNNKYVADAPELTFTFISGWSRGVCCVPVRCGSKILWQGRWQRFTLRTFCRVKTFDRLIGAKKNS